MKKTTIYTLVFVLILASAALAAPKKAAKPAGPALSVAEDVYEAGEVKGGQKITHDFIIKNEGNQDLEIVRVSAGCGCTAAKFDKVIAPNQSGVVTITVNYSDDWVGRKITQSALIETNDPKARHVSLTIAADVVAP